jgi:hypothetical protein
MVLIYSVTGFLMKHYDHIVNFFSAMLIGIFGTVLLVMFFAGLMTMGTIEKLLPFIIGFNAALTGYNLIRRMKDRLKYNRIWSVISGITLVVGVTLILNIAFYYLTGGYIVYMTNFLILALIGGVFSWLGTILAIRYFKLDIMNN